MTESLARESITGDPRALDRTEKQAEALPMVRRVERCNANALWIFYVGARMTLIDALLEAWHASVNDTL